MSELDDAVRRWAQGVYPVEAGAELLIRQGKAIYEGAPWLRDIGTAGGQRMVAIGPETLWMESRSWSGSERRLVNVAVSLLDSEPTVNLHDAVTGLHPESLELVLAAIAHAAGSHEARMPVIDGGKLTGYTEPVNAQPWPERLNTIGSTPRQNRAVALEPGDTGRGLGRSL
jgi:hypothetical protein